jgi:hypothetical protein
VMLRTNDWVRAPYSYETWPIHVWRKCVKRIYGKGWDDFDRAKDINPNPSGGTGTCSTFNLDLSAEMLRELSDNLVCEHPKSLKRSVYICSWKATPCRKVGE